MLFNFMKNYIKYIQEQLPIITLVPVIIGGILQVLILGSIGLGYIRFFSISQVLSDGLLILAIIIACFIGGILPKLYFDGKFDLIEYSSDVLEKTQKKIITTLRNDSISNILSLVLVLFSLWLIYRVFQGFSIANNDSITKVLGIALSISLGFELLIGAASTIIDRTFNFYKRISDGNSTKSILRVLLYGGIIIYTLTQMLGVFLNEDKIDKYFYGSFSFPNNLRNMEELNLSQNQKIIYFNDRFIFIRDSENKNINVLKFESLFSRN